MPVNPTYPGVYVEEIPSGVRPITGVSTSVAAFVDYFRTGRVNRAVKVLNMGDFERAFGGLDTNSEASYAIQQFFLNGGSEAWVVRVVGPGAASAAVTVLDGIGGAAAFDVTARDQGTWGNNLRVAIDYNTVDPATLFNMKISEYSMSNGRERLVRSELFRNLSMNAAAVRFVTTVVNDQNSGSKLVRVGALGANRPLQNGTVSGDLSTFPALTSPTPELDVTIGTEGTYKATLERQPASLREARSLLEKAIRSSKPDSAGFASATVEVISSRLCIATRSTSARAPISFAAGGTDPTVGELELDSASAQPARGLISGDLSAFPALTSATPSLDITIGGEGPHTAQLAAAPADLAAARTDLETAIRGASAAPAFANAWVAVYDDGAEQRLVILAGADENVTLGVSATDNTTLDELLLGAADARAINATVSDDLATFPALTSATPSLDITVGGEGPHTIQLAPAPADLAAARTDLETAIRGASAAPVFGNARVAVYDDGTEQRLVICAESPGNAVSFSAAPADATTVAELMLDAANATANVQEYQLGVSTAITGTAQGTGTAGVDGTVPGAAELRTGIYALEDADIFNILCIPRTATVSGDHPLTGAQAGAVISEATTYCEKRRAVFLVDTPSDVTDVEAISNWLDANATLRNKNAVVYFPRVRIADPLNEYRLRSVGACGTVAGLYARTDRNTGVWKAPAGTDAALVNVQELDYVLTDEQNGLLNPLAINCLRRFSVYGNVCWGGRTLEGADVMASEWKYLPVRRTALFIEESLYRGTKWVVFKPNDEPLWAQIRLNVGAFMQRLFRQGAFQGTTPREAYLVKCDKETTTQDDINLGIVNIVVGFAPLKPAEFVILQIQQLAGQVES